MRLTGSRTYYRPSPPKMPPGLVELMEGLTREVLKQNPSDIYEFCANHAQQLLEKRDGPSNKKSLSLEEKIARAQQKVRQRAEIRKQMFDKKNSDEHSHAQTSNVANNEEINVTSMLPVPQTNVIDDSTKVDFEPNNDNLDLLQDQIAESSLKAPVHHENELEKSSEVEVYHKSGFEFITQDQAYDGDPSSTEAYEVNVDPAVNIHDSKVESKITDNVHEGHLGSMNNNDSIIIPMKKQTVSDNIASKEVYVTEKEGPYLSVAQVQNTSIDNEKVSVPESVNLIEDASIIDLDPKLVHRTEKEESIASMTQIQDADQNSSKDNEILGLPESVNLVEDATITIDDFDSNQVYVTEKEKSISSMIHNAQISGEDNEIINVDKDAVIKIDEANILHVISTVENNSEDLESGNNNSDIRNAINIETEQEKKSKDDADMQDDASDISQTDENFKEVDYNTISVTLENKVCPSGEKLAPSSSVLHSHEGAIVDSESLDLKNNPSYQENTPADEDNISTSKEPKAVKLHLEKPDKEPDYLYSIEPNSVMTLNVAFNEIDPKNILDSDTSTSRNVTHKNQINESTSATSTINDDKNLPEEIKDVLDKSLVEISSNINVNVDALDRQQNSENSDLFANSGRVPSHIPEIVKYNTSEIKSSLPIDNDSEKDTHQNSGMDLETAAITIQKVFRSFLFRSRGSISEDTVNDDTMFLEEDINKEAWETIESISPKNLDRRAHGITRMDTVLQTVNEEKSLSLSTDDSSTLSSAATIIQAHVRGFLVRNKMNSNKTNSSLAASISNDLPTTPVDSGNDQQSKTVLNIHIVPESGDDLSRDESLITSMDLSLDSPSSTNLHPSSDDKSDRRKRLKREDAIQSVSPPSNNSGKLSDEIDSVKEIVADSSINESNSSKTELCNTEDNRIVSKEESLLKSTEINKDDIENTVNTVDNEFKLNQKRKSLTKMNSDERDVVTPDTSNNDSGLVHSGEFHDAVVPTKVLRSDTSVVSGE